jgi:autotransporter passenger strand-loop-strand repeat protein
MTIVSNGSDLQVSGGQFSAGIIVLSGGTLEVLSGGSVSGTDDSGLVVVSSGGFANATVISSGGKQDVYGGAVSAHVLSGGKQDIHTSAEADGDIIDGGIVSVASGGRNFSATINSGGTLIISPELNHGQQRRHRIRRRHLGECGLSPHSHG